MTNNNINNTPNHQKLKEIANQDAWKLQRDYKNKNILNKQVFWSAIF